MFVSYGDHMINLATLISRVKTCVLLVLAAAILWIGAAYLSVVFSSLSYKISPKISGIYVSEEASNDPVEWLEADDDSLVIYALGDTGSASEEQYEVGSAMNKLAGTDKPSCVMLLGDNFYPSGVASAEDPLWQTAFENPYAGDNLQIPFYACLGNHDHKGNIHAQLDKNVKSKRWNMPDFNYTFCPDSTRPDFLEVFIIDTDPHTHDEETFKKSVETLNRNLKASKAHWKIVAGHHPLQSGGRPSYHGDKLKDLLLDKLVENDVDLYLCGHDHHMEMGSVDNLIAYVVVGSGGSVRPRIVKSPNMHFAASRLGFARLKCTQEKIILSLTTEKGEAIYTESISK